MPLIVFLRYAHEGLCIPIIPNQAYNGVPEPRTCTADHSRYSGGKSVENHRFSLSTLPILNWRDFLGVFAEIGRWNDHLTCRTCMTLSPVASLLPSVFPSLLCFPLLCSAHLTFALPVLFFFALWLFLALSISNRPVAYDTLEMSA